MENNHHKIHGEKHPQPWRSCKLIIDPALKNGFYKVYRYDGQYFNMPVKDLGVFPVDTVRDPRIRRLWTKFSDTDLLVPKFKIDECYVGPPKEVTFARLNDNVRESFLRDMCKKYGEIEDVEILYNPKNKKHLGIARVIFDTVKAAKDTVEHLHATSVMGNIIHVELDPKGKNRLQYFHLLVSGLYTPWTLPLGSDGQTLQSLSECLQDSKPLPRLSDGSMSSTLPVCSPTSVATPLSLDTAYSSIWQDTPGSFGQTPLSQGTPRTPCLSVTPLSQDSCYSSQHTTPIHHVSQAEHPSTSVDLRRLKRDVCYRQPGRSYVKSHHRNSELSSLLKRIQTPHPPPFQNQAAGSSYRSSWYPQASANDNPATETPLHLSLSDQEPWRLPSLPPACEAFPLGINTARPTGTNTDPLGARSPQQPDRDIPGQLPGSPMPEAVSHSLDSRIEMLLSKRSRLPVSGDRAVDEVLPQDSPGSPGFPVSMDSPECEGTPASSLLHAASDGLGNITPTPLPLSKGDTLVPAIPSVKWTSQPPTPPGTTSGTQTGRCEGAIMEHVDPTALETKYIRRDLCSLSLPQRLHLPRNYRDTSDGQRSGMSSANNDGFKVIPNISPAPCFRQPLPFSSVSHTVPIPPHHPPPPIAFNLPIRFPPSNTQIPPIPAALSNGVILVPPPGFPLLPPHISPPVPLNGAPPLRAPLPPLLPPFYPYSLNNLHMDRVNGIPRYGSVPGSFDGPRWPLPPVMPTFDPSVPPPGYQPLQEDPHKVTVEKVLAVITEELKSIVKRDINRKIIEGTAFRAFDEWWDSQEQRAKTAITLERSREDLVEVKPKPRDPMKQNMGLHGAPILPSFKVKKKDPDDPTSSKDSQKTLPSTPVTDVHHTELDSEVMNYTSEGSPEDGSLPAVRRRHARPKELDSEMDEEDEAEEEGRSGEVQPATNKEQNTVATCTVPQHQGDEDDDTDEEKEEVDRDEDHEGPVLSTGSEGVQSSDEEHAAVSLSEAASSGYSRDPSDSESSEDSEDSSDYDSSSEEETREVECIVLSSDEEDMNVEPTPSAPLTPGTQLDVLDGSEQSILPGEDHLSLCLHANVLGLDLRLDVLPREAPSSIGLPDFEVEINRVEWSVGSPHNEDILRPPTPSGSLEDSDLELLFRSKTTPPAVEEVELPHTPGRGAEALLHIEEDNMNPLFFLSPADSEPFSQSRFTLNPATAASYLAYEDTPQTPGREATAPWGPPTPGAVPATPGRETSFTDGGLGFIHTPCSPLLCSLSTSLRTPRTPGRDFTPTPRSFQKTTLIKAISQRPNPAALSCGEMRSDSHVFVASSPSSRSESSEDDRGDVWPTPHPGSQSKIPLQGLENRPRLPADEERREGRKCSWRRVRQRPRWRARRRMRRWQRMSSLQIDLPSSVLSAYFCSRSRREEMAVLHSIWRQGLDEEDATLLQDTYDRLLRQDNGFSWLSDTLWVPHPITRDLTENNERSDWMRYHVTGSARSEGFYKLSKKDKIKYVNSLRLLSDHPSAEPPAMAVQVQPSMRSGSDFRSEQRRLLSSFSCDSDLLRFNQLKFRKKKIRFCRSHIHDWGLFAMEPIAADEMVIEYVGQCIRQVIADMREKRYEDEGIGSSYLFRVDQDTIIDATKCGNLARFINHSCNPNCYAKIITVESRKKIVIYSRQPICVNEEITYDYKFPIEDDKIPCLCGAHNCQGSLN